jgi:hypothetical protein
MHAASLLRRLGTMPGHDLPLAVAVRVGVGVTPIVLNVVALLLAYPLEQAGYDDDVAEGSGGRPAPLRLRLCELRPPQKPVCTHIPNSLWSPTHLMV